MRCHLYSLSTAFSNRCVFSEYAERIRAYSSVLVWTEGRNASICMRFQTKTHWCGQVQTGMITFFYCSVLCTFETGWDKTRKRIRNAERNSGSGFRKRNPQMRIKRGFRFRNPQMRIKCGFRFRNPQMGIKRGFRFRNPQMGIKRGFRFRNPQMGNCVKMIKKQIKTKINKLTSMIPLSGEK